MHASPTKRSRTADKLELIATWSILAFVWISVAAMTIAVLYFAIARGSALWAILLVALASSLWLGGMIAATFFPTKFEDRGFALLEGTDRFWARIQAHPVGKTAVWIASAAAWAGFAYLVGCQLGWI